MKTEEFNYPLPPSLIGTNGTWEALLKGFDKVKQGTRIKLEQGFEAEVEEIKDGKGKIRFQQQEEVTEILKKMGHIPLPPYIKRKDEPLDRDRYQTVFAERDGSIASPTAGLPFTQEMLQSLQKKGVKIAMATLHIGIGTFAPVKVKQVA